MIKREELQEDYKVLYGELMESLTKLVACPSVYDADTITPTAPFGKGIDDALNTAIDICSKIGLRTFKDPEGYYGYAEIGEGDILVGVLCHLDVVPTEDLKNWNSEPFTLTQVEDRFFARGVADNKSPTMINLYSLKALIKRGFVFKKRIRFIFGTDEETGWRCIERYIKNEEIPAYGITPDGQFPVVYSEAHIVNFTLKTKGDKVVIEGGGAFNAIPTSIDYSGVKQEELIKELERQGFEYKKNEGSVTVVGKAAHVAAAEKGINPIGRLMMSLHNIGIESPSIKFVGEMIKDSPHAEPLLGLIEDDITGKLRMNLSKVQINEDESTLYFDFRIPVSSNFEEVINSIKEKAAQYGLEYVVVQARAGMTMPKDSDLIKNLCKIYHEETGFDTTPLSTSGGTYSRAIKNFVTFGMRFPDGVQSAHQPNEYIRVKDIERAFMIYGRALAYLGS